MELIASKDAPARFGISRTTFMTLKKYDSDFPPVRGQAGKGHAYDLTELAVYFAKRYPEKDALAFLKPAGTRKKGE